ncbi:hypothetical protein SPURM210S_03428 [Streptomyces purpurascens]
MTAAARRHQIRRSSATGLCDSSRCPQATHHIIHRSVWQTTADNGVVLLASPRIPPAEKARLRAEYERSMRVLEEIDTAAGKARIATWH